MISVMSSNKSLATATKLAIYEFLPNRPYKEGFKAWADVPECSKLLFVIIYFTRCHLPKSLQFQSITRYPSEPPLESFLSSFSAFCLVSSFRIAFYGFWMDFNFNTLEPHIRSILSAPGTDLSTISAKRVRKQLVEYEPVLTLDFLRQNREIVDGVITRVFEAVTEEKGGFGGSQESEGSVVREANGARKRRKEGSVVHGPVKDEDDEEETPPPKKAKKVAKGGSRTMMSDAELARQLSSEINGRSRRSSAGAKPRAMNGSSTKKSKKKKSAAMVDSDGDDSDEDEDEKKPKAKRKSTGAAKGGFAREYLLR
jgi:upstream activation factor subunit UAF30